MKSKTGILLTLDAFGTLYTPREPIAKQYGDAARRRGLRGFSDDDVGSSFRKSELDHIDATVLTCSTGYADAGVRQHFSMSLCNTQIMEKRPG